jgi:hypothetical protein
LKCEMRMRSSPLAISLVAAGRRESTSSIFSLSNK